MDGLAPCFFYPIGLKPKFCALLSNLVPGAIVCAVDTRVELGYTYSFGRPSSPNTKVQHVAKYILS